VSTSSGSTSGGGVCSCNSIGDDLRPLLKLGILRLDSVLKIHDHVGAGVHLLTGNVDLLQGVVQPMLSITKAVVRDLQLKILLCRLMCPTMEESVLVLKPLHCMQHEGGLLNICVQMRTLLGDDSTDVVLQVNKYLVHLAK
jgi:hypothetical protein